MIENYRRFEVGPDPFGRIWQVEYKWQQTAISIRHCDAVDVKFYLMQGEHVQEKIISLRHPDLLALSAKVQRPLTDAWCMKLAALHVKHMIETDVDMEKTLVTASLEDMERYHAMLKEHVPAA
ncbi:MAG TPA: hypothetical protein VMZ52_10160 [Bryobacteraceae bacterium]|nr:hypothetical protein [Bryobacteraceae bacterium]